MFVYVMRSKKNTDGPIKIGKAKDPAKRLKILQTGNHEKLAIIHLVKCKSDMNASAIEREFHRKLSRMKINGEWFKSHAIGEFRRLMGEMQFQDRRRYPPAIKGCWTL